MDLIFCNKLRIANNLGRLREFLDILSPAASFLQSEELFTLIEAYKTTITGKITNQSIESGNDFSDRRNNVYFRQWKDDPAPKPVAEIIRSMIGKQTVVPYEYAEMFDCILHSEKTPVLENNFYGAEHDNYIDFAYRNAEYHYAMYDLLGKVFSAIMNNISASKYYITDYGYSTLFLYSRAKEYKNRLIRFGLLSSNQEINERAKMILTSSELIYCEKSFTEEHHCRVKFTSEFFKQGGDDLKNSISCSYSHVKSLRKEIRDVHNPLFEKYMDTL